MNINSISDLRDEDLAGASIETQEYWIKEMSEKMSPEEVLSMWENKIANKTFLLILLRLYHESVRKHNDGIDRTKQNKDRAKQNPSQSMTLTDILNAMAKN